MATSKKAVAKKDAKLPSYIKQGENRGNENVQSEDLQLPLLGLLQALSPQVNKKKDEYIQGAEVGMLFNTLTGELYEDGLDFTPVSFVKRFLVWVDRKKDQNGGLRGVFDTEAAAETFVEEQEDEDKLEIVATAEHLILLDDGTEMILSLGKSKMKVSRKFNSLVRLNGGDRFSRRYHISSVDDESAQGEYQNFSISNAEDIYPSEDVYNKAEKLYEAISSGVQKQKSGNYQAAGETEEY